MTNALTKTQVHEEMTSRGFEKTSFRHAIRSNWSSPLVEIVYTNKEGRKVRAVRIDLKVAKYRLEEVA